MNFPEWSLDVGQPGARVDQEGAVGVDPHWHEMRVGVLSSLLSEIYVMACCGSSAHSPLLARFTRVLEVLVRYHQ